MAHDLRLYGGLLSALPALAHREPGYVKDQPRLYVGNTSYGNTLLSVLKKVDAAAAPTVNDDAGDGYSVGSIWTDTTNDKSYICSDSTVGAAVWQQFSGTGSGGINQLTGDVTAGPGSGSQAATIANNAVTYAKLQDASATARILSRITAGAGDWEEATITQVLDLLGSTANGDIPYRDTTWKPRAIGTRGQRLEVNSSTLPAWEGYHGCRVYNSGSQNITTATTTAVSFDSERNDTDAFHSTVTNTSRMTVPTGMGGNYAIGGGIAWDTTGSPGSCAVGLMVNGTTLIAYKTLARLLATNLYMAVHTEYVLAAGDYVELIVWQNSGGTISIISSTNVTSEAWMHWIGP